jgi:hypothetical protein
MNEVVDTCCCFPVGLFPGSIWFFLGMKDKANKNGKYGEHQFLHIIILVGAKLGKWFNKML